MILTVLIYEQTKLNALWGFRNNEIISDLVFDKAKLQKKYISIWKVNLNVLRKLTCL